MRAGSVTGRPLQLLESPPCLAACLPVRQGRQALRGVRRGRAGEGDGRSASRTAGIERDPCTPLAAPLQGLFKGPFRTVSPRIFRPFSIVLGPIRRRAPRRGGGEGRKPLRPGACLPTGGRPRRAVLRSRRGEENAACGAQRSSTALRSPWCLPERRAGGKALRPRQGLGRQPSTVH